jgi:hypothetical protein
MDRSNLEMYYLSLTPIKSMFENGFMTKQDYLKVESLLADKYCIKKGNLYRLFDLTIPRSRVIDSVSMKEDKVDEQINHQERHITKVTKEN